MEQSVVVELGAACISLVALIVSGLSGKLWFMLWNVIDELRKELSKLNELVTDLRIKLAVVTAEPPKKT